MIVIASAANVAGELAAEFGEIPPCMLPLGNKSLFEWQANVLHRHFPDERIALSLPESYEPSAGNVKLLSDFGIELVSVPDGLNLAESLLFVINTAADDGASLRVLHGDTLIDGLPSGNDVMAVAPTQTDYDWEIEALGAQEEIVWCGYFSFSNARLFTKCLAMARGDFVVAVRSYDEEKQLERYNTGQWFDLGHINTYFASRARLTTERSFNDLNIEDGLVRKSGSHHRKIEAEANWYLSIPPKIRKRTPQLIDYGNADGNPYYTLEYLNLTPLSELFVHGRNPTFFWTRAFSHCDRFLGDCVELSGRTSDVNGNAIEEAVSKDMRELLVAKTWTRLREFAETTDTSLDMHWVVNGRQLPSLREISDRCMAVALDQCHIAGVMHGDFCFSNILFDSRADAIKVIDPRGINHAGEFTIYGDLVYDLAKLTHSVVGLYDFILADMYRLEVADRNLVSFTIYADSRIVEVQRMFLERRFIAGRLQPRKIMPQVILLFLSMLPLHADSARRQLALMANALRLYAEFEREL